MVDMQVDDEVLFQYALALGMHENSAAQTRLAQIADFVEANPHDATQAGKAHAAMELGLHEGDLVVRRILVDSARRLIRSVVLLQQPTPEIVEQFYAAHAAEFTRAGAHPHLAGRDQRLRASGLGRAGPAGCSRGSARRSSTSRPRWRSPTRRRRRCTWSC